MTKAEKELFELQDAIHEVLLGKKMSAVLLVCMAGVCTAAKDLGMSKLDVQRELITMWESHDYPGAKQ